MKKLIIFGATGGTGQELVKQALELKYDVTVFARSPEKLKISNKNFSTIRGNVLNPEDVENAIKNQEIVVCSLGMPASDKSTVRRDGTVNIINAMEKNGVKRLICQSTLGFGDSEKILPWYMKYIIVPFILKNAFRDHQLQETEIENSSLDWTIVRPANLTNGKRTSNFKFGFNVYEKIELRISRADVAEFMLSQIKNLKFLRKKVGLSY